MEEIVTNKKWCPEETIYQIGNIDGTIDYKELAMVVTETMQEIDRRFGEYCRTMDWGLHIDEKTPHIHERHVFFAPDEYGLYMPQQEEACRRMGLELPDKESEQGRYNNRKMTFDKECRTIFLEKCKEHGIELEVEPIYGGKKYQEKQEFITSQINMKNQNVQIENGQLLIDNSILIEERNDLKAEIRELDDEKLLDSTDGDQMNNFFVVALGTGMRMGEILGLNWDCVHFDTGMDFAPFTPHGLKKQGRQCDSPAIIIEAYYIRHN